MILRHSKTSTAVARYEVVGKPSPQAAKTYLKRENGSVFSTWWTWESNMPDNYELVKADVAAAV